MSLLIDTGQMFYCVRRAHSDRRIDYKKYLQEIEDIFGKQNEIIAYIARPDASADRFVEYLRGLCTSVVVKEPRSFGRGIVHTNFNVELCCDAYRLAGPNKLVIIGSSDPHLLPLLQYLSPRTGCLYVYAAGIPAAFKQHAQIKEIGSNVLRTAITA